MYWSRLAYSISQLIFKLLIKKRRLNLQIILGRPPLAIEGALIDVKNGKITFHVSDENKEFQVCAN